MNTDLTPIDNPTLVGAAAQPSGISIRQDISQLTPGSTNVGYVNQFNNKPSLNINFYGGNQRQRIIVCNECCNLVVVMGGNFTSGCFTIPQSKCGSILTESGDVDARVMTYPSLLMATNKKYRACANPLQEFYLGYITDIQPQGNLFVVMFQRQYTATPLYQDRLNAIALNLGINTNDGRDMLDKTGWTVLKRNILNDLSTYGIDYT
jgi:hypothetical protein